MSPHRRGAFAPHPAAATFSPQAGRRDKRRQPNPAFTVRPRERAGAAYPFSPPAGRRWRQPVEGQPRPSGVEAVGFPRDPFMSSIRRTGAQEICACRSIENGEGAGRRMRGGSNPMLSIGL
ncbi:hypothetical protein CDO30_16885 [Sinorhizobium meliloti]|nr:hypothetical protein CDO31_07915 [Sinorhizobium meliloti]ASP59803.1 hypothetical protein CDO30_16885 [Sinorhizobium meliloti]ASP63729.1 hypothetical protein CDO29_03500 [Sinorhizobium meliloti]ASP84192.1 hypothetical protein CDO26_05985 [Sinorhizobium meliloti]ASP91443.1 hypothetical protein CDO25_09690 [Sinorhizobium meliloti]